MRRIYETADKIIFESCNVNRLRSDSNRFQNDSNWNLFYLFILFISLLKNYNVVKENKL